MTKEPFGTIQIFLALFALLRGDFSHAENMMAGSCPMCGAMGWVSRLMYLTAVSSHLLDGTRKEAFSKLSLCPCQHPWFLSAL